MPHLYKIQFFVKIIDTWKCINVVKMKMLLCYILYTYIVFDIVQKNKIGNQQIHCVSGALYKMSSNCAKVTR